MKVLISGAGIAGLMTAYWLKRYGFTPTIIERAPGLVTGGYKIDVRGKALEILHRTGIYDAVVAGSTDMQGALLIDKEGKVLHEMSGDEFGHRTGDDLEIIRGKLCEILMDQIPDVEFIFGDVIEEISQSTSGALVKFKHHQSREFDLVIGADGLHSNVRQRVFGDEASFLHNLDFYLCVFTVPNYLNLDRMEMQYTELGKIFAVWSARGEPSMKACFGFASSTAIDLHDKTKQQQAIRDQYKEFGWEVPKFMKAMPDSPDFYFDAAAQIHMDHWSKGRVALVGDAAYCASPMSGQGSSLALIGAYVLAGELGSANGDYQKAFEQYEKLMRPFIKLNQALGLRASERMKAHERNDLLSNVLQFLMKVMPGQLAKFFINRSTRQINQAANAINLNNYLNRMK